MKPILCAAVCQVMGSSAEKNKKRNKTNKKTGHDAAPLEFMEVYT